MPFDPQQAQSLFHAAIELPVDQRAAFLDRACAGNAELRRHVEKLLVAHEKPATSPAPPQQTGAYTPPSAAGPVAASAEGPGAWIGPYKLLQEIGEGGMGVIYMAEQEEPVRRRVALKIIKPGMDSRQVVARFEVERQALAMMDHQNIARVLDAGTTASGRPYFVMELVKGVPITRYCDDNRLTPRERLELFIPVCQAIQHAHQKGIIHRDVKPSNVLVTLYDGRPVPKVIDFGVAKALEQRLTEKTMFTAFGQVVGTLEYMSPEQAEMNALDIDTRSDIYSLGVLLYELLTGSTPLDRQRLRQAAMNEALRLIREEEPPKPSTRLSGSGASLQGISAQRKTEPRKLLGLMRGDLDWIVMKALEKDRTRRYETANGFGMDIQRYLHDEPVYAGPPSASYRVRKFVRRNRSGVLVAAALVLALAVGALLSTWQAIRATEAETKATNALEAETEQTKIAKREAATTKAISEFVRNDLLAQTSAHGQAGSKHAVDKDIKLRVVLDRAAERIKGRFTDQPLVEAAIRQTIGDTYVQLTEYDQAQEHLERSYELRRQHLHAEDPDVLRSLSSLAYLYLSWEKLERAESIFVPLLDIYRRKLGPDSVEALTCANGMAETYLSRRNMDAAGKLLIDTERRCRESLGPDHLETARALYSLAYVDWSLEHWSECEQRAAQAFEIRRQRLGPDHPDTLGTMDLRATALYSLGRSAEAKALFQQGLDIAERALGKDHDVTCQALHSLAWFYAHENEFTKAEPLYLTVRSYSRVVFGIRA